MNRVRRTFEGTGGGYPSSPMSRRDRVREHHPHNRCTINFPPPGTGIRTKEGGKMKKFFVLLLLLLTLSGCGGSQFLVQGEGPGTLGLARIAIAIHEAKMNAVCKHGFVSERRDVEIRRTPVDLGPNYKPFTNAPRQDIRISGEYRCKEAPQ